MRKFNPSSAALVIACLALFAALGGTSLAASLLIGTNQIQDGAVTSSKIGAHQVRSRNLGPGAVKTDALADNSVTSSKVAPNTFLPATGTANNSLALGGHPAGDFLAGRGGMFVNRVSVPAGQTRLLISLGFGDLLGKCAAGGVPQTEYQSDVNSVNLVDSVTDYGSPSGTASIHTTNGLGRGGIYIESHTTVVPQAITWQAAYDDGTPHVATAWTTGQDIGTTSCIFIAQGLASN
jgi:hypothetical protein